MSSWDVLSLSMSQRLHASALKLVAIAAAASAYLLLPRASSPLLPPLVAIYASRCKLCCRDSP